MLTFNEPGDLYEFMLLWRKKDHPDAPANESQRRLKCWEIDSLERFDKKISLMKELSDANDARLYFLPQVRNKKDVNRDFLKWFAEWVDHTDVKYQNLVPSIIAKCSKSRAPRWVVDLDRDSKNFIGGHADDATFAEYVKDSKACITAIIKKSIELGHKRAEEERRKALAEGKEVPDEAPRAYDDFDADRDIIAIPTPNGFHLITPPFDRSGNLGTLPFTANEIHSDPGAEALVYYTKK